ncbi:MAG TPA: hypothetical protein VIV61_18315 [Candidatus Ozemobacteraceae bacterium]
MVSFTPRSLAVAVLLAHAFCGVPGFCPAQEPSPGPLAATLSQEITVVGDDAAFVGSEPAQLVPHMPETLTIPPIRRPTADDLSGLIPLLPDGSAPIELPDTEAGAMILPPVPGSALPAEIASAVPPWPFEKLDGIEIALIKGAEIVSSGETAAAEEQSAILLGRLAIEEHYVARKRSFRRWVLKTDEGDRIPLTSNFTLLSAVKAPGMADERVKATGKWVSSATDPRLKFFTADRFEAVGTMSVLLPDASGTASIASAVPSLASAPLPVATPPSLLPPIASPTAGAPAKTATSSVEE